MGLEKNPERPVEEKKEKIELKPNEESFREMEALLVEGWRLGPHDFLSEGAYRQVYRVAMAKEGEDDRVFYTTVPYRKIVDSEGKLKDGYDDP